MEIKSVKIISPWQEYQKEIVALFERDPQITVSSIYDYEGKEANYGFDIEVRDHDKYEALARVLPSVKKFGNVTLKITLYETVNNSNAEDLVAVYTALFRDNPIVDDVCAVVDIFGIKHAYVMFKPEVIQYYRDELMDFNGLRSCLAQDIAKEVFDNSSYNLHFCTTPVKGF